MSDQLVGTSRPPRYLAGCIDNTAAAVTSIVIASSLSEYLNPRRSSNLEIALGLSVAAFYLLYFFLFEWLLTATPGKLLCGLTVRHLDGGRCGARAVFLRTATRLLEVNPILLGCLPAALFVRSSKLRQRWGDKLANTVVADRDDLK